jgi:hypothetical protein
MCDDRVATTSVCQASGGIHAGYRKIDLSDPRHMTDDIEILNAAGEEGWEVVHITANNVAYLKRDGEKAEAADRQRRDT